jgi:glucokinase
MILAADVGATKADLALYEARGAAREPLWRTRVASGRYASLEALLADVLPQGTTRLCFASLAVPGPVRQGRAHLTNLPWDVEAERIAGFLGAPTRLINDVQALAYAVPELEEEDREILREGKSDPEGAIAVLAVGTGLGEAFLIRGREGYVACPSEGGHAGFAPCNALQLELLAYLQRRFGHVSIERVCSGRALPFLYEFFREKEPQAADPAVEQALRQSPDPTPVIIERGLLPVAEASLVCRRALELFVTILASEAGDFALKIFALGGVYLAGGIPPKILPLCRESGFREAFQEKGRLSFLLREIPVYLLKREGAALLGAYSLARREVFG